MPRTIRCPRCGVVGSPDDRERFRRVYPAIRECLVCTVMLEVRRLRSAVEVDADVVAAIRAREAEEAERRRPWWEQESLHAVGPVEQSQIDRSVTKLVEVAADRGLTIDRLTRRFDKAGRRYARSDWLDGYLSRPARDVIDWSVTRRGHWPNSPFNTVGNSMLGWLVDGYLMGRVLYGTSKQAHDCRVGRTSLLPMTRALLDREGWQPNGVCERFQDRLVGRFSDRDPRISPETAHDLLGDGLAIAVAHHASHGLRLCSEWRDGADYS